MSDKGKRKKENLSPLKTLLGPPVLLQVYKTWVRTVTRAMHCRLKSPWSMLVSPLFKIVVEQNGLVIHVSDKMSLFNALSAKIPHLIDRRNKSSYHLNYLLLKESPVDLEQLENFDLTVATRDGTIKLTRKLTWVPLWKLTLLEVLLTPKELSSRKCKSNWILWVMMCRE